MNFPLISVVVCTYNGEKFLEEQIQSIIDQTYPNLEIIISDDNSTDQTKSILKKYEDYKRFKIIYNEINIGFTKNFEAASLLATGNFIAFSDQDDVWLPMKIEKLWEAIGNYSLAYSNSTLINAEGLSLDKNLDDFRKMKDVITDSRGFVFHNVVSGHTMMVKKELLTYALPVPGNFYHDWWFAIQAANLNGVIYLNEALTLYRQHNTTVTKTIVDKKVGSRKLEKRYNDYLKDLEWLKLFKNNRIEKNKAFYNRLFKLYLLKRNGHFVWPLFFFLLRNEKTIFQFFKKNYVSKLIEIRKMARGEKAPGLSTSNPFKDVPLQIF